MSVHYKFKSGKEAHTITFDSLHISVGELKKCIMQQRKIGKSAELDLQITNAQTKEVYESDSILIPKNTSVIVARVPVAPTKKSWNKNDKSTNNTTLSIDENPKSSKSNNLVEGTEDDKIKEMLTQSTKDYDPSKYARGKGPLGPLPPNYTCYRCGKPGHYIKHCPTNNVDVKRSTGIPRSFMIPAKADQKGAMITAIGEYAVPIIDHDAYREVKKEKPPFFPTEVEPEVPKVEIPDDLKCSLCNNLLQDAVLIPCCGNSFCDECIRSLLLDSDNHECPSCKETEVSPDTLIPNRFLRLSVTKFKNETLAAIRPATDEKKVAEGSDEKTEESPQTNDQKENETNIDPKMETDFDKVSDKDKDEESENEKEMMENDNDNDEDKVKIKVKDEDDEEDSDKDEDKDKSDESRNNGDHDMESENENENNKNENNKNESENENEKVKDEDDNTNDSRTSEPIKLSRPTNNPIRVRSSNQPTHFLRLPPGPMLHRNNNYNQNRTLLPNESAFFNYPMQQFAQVGMPMQHGGFGPQMRNNMFSMFNNRGAPMNPLLPFGGNLNMAALGGHPMMDMDGHFFQQYKYDNLDEIDQFNRHLESRSRQRRYSRERSRSRSGRSNSRSRNDNFKSHDSKLRSKESPVFSRRSRSPMRSSRSRERRRSVERKRSPFPAYGKDKSRDRRIIKEQSKDRDRSRRSAEKSRDRERERERDQERNRERSRRDHSREKKSKDHGREVSRRKESEKSRNSKRKAEKSRSDKESNRSAKKGPKEKREQSSKKKIETNGASRTSGNSHSKIPSTVHSANDGDAHCKGN